MDHVWYKCPQPCERPGSCMYCDGGLAFCTVCEKGEGELASECPGEERTFTLTASGEPTDDEVVAFQEFAKGLDWFSDYDCGVSILIPDKTLRVDPGDTVVRQGEHVSVRKGAAA